MPNTMEFAIPLCLKEDHDELRLDLIRAMSKPEPLGSAATSVRESMCAHVFNKEHCALSLLGLLASLARGEATPEMLDVVTLTDDLKRDLPAILTSHKRTIAALKQMIAAATVVEKPEFVVLAERLMQHIQIKEQIGYPAAILIGEFLKLKLACADNVIHAHKNAGCAGRR